MSDAVFRELLTEIAAVERPHVSLDGDGAPLTPRYEELASGVALRLMPKDVHSEDDLLGRTEDATHVAYLQPMDLRASDRLVLRPVSTALADDLEADDTEVPVIATSGLLDGQTVEIGSGGTLEESVIALVGEDAVTLVDGVVFEHAADERVSVVERYEVITIEDEAGAGHHLRAVVRAL